MDGHGNSEVSTEERSITIAKLQNFLLDVLKETPESMNKAAELAKKFEFHVFTTTNTRDEYSRVIIAKMQQVQQRRRSVSEEPLITTSAATTITNSNIMKVDSPQDFAPLALPDLDKHTVFQKMTQLVKFLPEMDHIISLFGKNEGHLANNDALKRYVAYRSLIHKQSRLMQKGTFVMTVNLATNLVDQVPFLSSQLKKVLSANENQSLRQPLSRPSNSSQDNGLSNVENFLLLWFRERRDDTKGFKEQRKSNNMLPIQFQWDGLTVKRDDNSFIDQLIEDEINSFRIINPTLEIIWEKASWGYSICCKYRENRIGVQLPLDYPSDKFYISHHFGNSALAMIHGIENECLRIVNPVSLTCILSIFFHHCNED